MFNEKEYLKKHEKFKKRMMDFFVCLYDGLD